MELLVAIIGSSATASLISGIFNVVMNHQKKEDGLEAGVRILLYDRLKYLGNSFIKHESISTDELEDFLKMHSVYHNALHGNGFLDALVAQVKALPLKKEE